MKSFNGTLSISDMNELNQNILRILKLCDKRITKIVLFFNSKIILALIYTHLFGIFYGLTVFNLKTVYYN